MLPNEKEVQRRTRDGDIDRHNSRTIREINRSGFPPTGMHKQSASYLLLIDVDDKNTERNSYSTHACKMLAR